MPAEDVPDSKNPPRRTWLRILGILAACVLVAALLSAWWVKSNLYASPFDPTALTDKEQQVLDAKLDRLQRNMASEPKASAARDAAKKSEGRLAPQPYTEEAARRELRLTEKELNALVAKDEFAAQRVAIALSTDLISVKLVVPVDEEFPILGGKTLRLNCGVTLRYRAMHLTQPATSPCAATGRQCVPVSPAPPAGRAGRTACRARRTSGG